MAALARDLVALLRERQAVDLDDVVEHAREDAHDFVVFVPVEARLRAERIAHERRQVDRAQQARAVRRQRLLAARVGRADVLAPPVVVHLVDAVDEDESGLGVVVRRDHDHVPQMPRADVAVDLARDEAVVAARRSCGASAIRARPPVSASSRSIFVLFLDVDREHQRPVGIVLNRVHEPVGDQQRQVELAQAPVLALGADEFLDVRVAHVERAHLRAAAAAGRRHGEAHLVVDIHERQRARRVRARARHVRAARTQRREFVADAAAGLQRQAGLVHLVQDVVHRIVDGARHGAVDRRGRRLVFLRAGVRGDAAGRDRAAAQRPEETFVPVLLLLGRRLGIGQRLGDALVGVVDASRRPARPAWSSGGTSCPRCRRTPAAAESPPRRAQSAQGALCSSCFFASHRSAVPGSAFSCCHPSLRPSAFAFSTEKGHPAPSGKTGPRRFDSPDL